MSIDIPESEDVGSSRPEPGPVDVSAVQVAWRALTAPTTGAVLAVLLAVVWGMALVIPQSASDGELLARFSYAQVQAIQSLGLQNIVTSWPSLALSLLLMLHVIGLILASSERQTEPMSVAADGWSRRASLELAGSIEALSSALSRGELGPFYGGSSVRKGEPGVRFWRGFWREGLIVIALGVGVTTVSIPVDLLWGLDARVRLANQPGESASKPISTEVRDFRGWVQGESPVELICQDPDPADALRRRACEARSIEGVFPVTVRAGKTVRVAGVDVTPSSERPRRQSRRTSLLLQAPGEGPRVLRAQPGRTYELATGSRLTIFEGPDGPLVVARDTASSRPFLLGPGGQGDELHAGHKISGIPGWLFNVNLQANPGQPLRWAGVFLLFVGLLLMVAVPHVELLLTPSSVGVSVVIRSNNRHDLPEQIQIALSSAREAL